MSARRAPFGSSLREKLLFHSQERSAIGCWLWTAALNNAGYPLITIPGVANRKRSAHRASYETFVGPIPDGMTLDHLCCVPRCINPAHLESVTRSENVRRMWDIRRAAAIGGAA